MSIWKRNEPSGMTLVLFKAYLFGKGAKNVSRIIDSYQKGDNTDTMSFDVDGRVITLEYNYSSGTISEK